MIELQTVAGAALLADRVACEDLSLKRRFEFGFLRLGYHLFNIYSQMLHLLPKMKGHLEIRGLEIDSQRRNRHFRHLSHDWAYKCRREDLNAY